MYFSYFITIALFTATCNFALSLDRGAREVEEWREIVEEAAVEWRQRRSADDDTASIVNIQDYYTKVFDSMNSDVSLQSDGPDTERPIRGRYIVLLQDYITDESLDQTIGILEKHNAKGEGLVARHIEPIRYVGKGFSATLSSNVADILKSHRSLYAIEKDVVLKRSIGSVGDHISRDYARAASTVPWNLDRIDQHEEPLDGLYVPEGSGKGVDVYVLDTGIRYTHQEFGGRAKYCGYDAIDELTGSTQHGSDCNGHGTHCAATIGGEHFGVAKEVNIYSSRVLDCTGTGSVTGIINAMEYIIKNRPNQDQTAVFSLSVGVEKSDVFNKAVDAVSGHNIVVVAASGNQGRDSCNYSPGSAKHSLSVAATDRNDESVTFSNVGACVDTFAPGSNIISAIHSCDTCTGVKSGTSMACPHVTGSAAVILGLNPGLSPQGVKEELLAQATRDVIDLHSMSQSLSVVTPNRMLYVGTDNN